MSFPPASWPKTGQNEFGLVLANGNADNLTVNARLDFKFEEDQGLYNVSGLALRSESGDLQTANRFEIGGTSGYKLNERADPFGSGCYENDDFAPHEDQVTLAVG